MNFLRILSTLSKRTILMMFAFKGVLALIWGNAKGAFSFSWHALLMLSTHQSKESGIKHFHLILKFLSSQHLQDSPIAMDSMMICEHSHLKIVRVTIGVSLWNEIYPCSCAPLQLRAADGVAAPCALDLCPTVLTYHYVTAPQKSKSKVGF